MTVGSATVSAVIAATLATLATLVFYVCRRLGANEYVTMFLYGVALVLVMLAGPLIKLP